MLDSAHGNVIGIAVACAIALALIAVAIIVPTRAQAIDLPTEIIVSICGDGITTSPEVCDNGRGFNTGLYATSTAERQCVVDCSAFGPYCGDGILQARFSEQCDDGNNTTGDLCSPTCTPEPPLAPPGSPNRGGVPSQNGAIAGTIPSEIKTQVVLRGKAFPNTIVNILLDGKPLGTARADSNADFLFTTTQITPGTASFGFMATDTAGTASLSTSVIFEVVQSAVTTVANIFIPPTLKLSSKQIAPGGLLTISGQTVPKAKVSTVINPDTPDPLLADADGSGIWALQIDTASLSPGYHNAKAAFELSKVVKSGYGRSMSFFIGDEAPGDSRSADLNNDGKVNLVDFSIFLISWNTDEERPDFNDDGKVNLADFSIMLFQWTG